MSLYTMKLSDSVDTMEFNLLEVPIQDKDIEGAVDNVVLSGDIYTDFLWLKKRFTHKWSILCKDDYERLRGFYTRQFSNAEVPIYQLLDAPSPIEESAGSGEYIQITTTDPTAKLASVEMLGNATQDGTPTPDAPVAVNTVTGENTVKITGKNLYNNDLPLDNKYLSSDGQWQPTTYSVINQEIPAAASTTYTWSASSTTGTPNLRLGEFDSSGNFIRRPLITQSTDRTFTTTATTALIVTSTDNTDTNKYNGPQLELGSTATTYEPYQAQELEVNLGKNLLDQTTFMQGVWNNPAATARCVVFVGRINSGETYTVTNLDTATYQFAVGVSTSNVQNGNTAVGMDSGWKTTTSASYTATGDGYLWLQLGLRSGASLTPSSITADTFMVEKGSTATSFAPYFPPIELAKIGNYQDRIYKEDSKWYIHRAVRHLSLPIADMNNNENYPGWTSVDHIRADLGANIDHQLRLTTDWTSNIALSASSSLGLNTNASNATLFSSGPTSIFGSSTQSQIKTDYPNLVMELYYGILEANQYDEEITNEALIAQLDALESASLYLGLNNIGTETQNAMPTLVLGYYPYYPNEIISPKAVRMELTDGGIINACECRENVQITLRETVQ